MALVALLVYNPVWPFFLLAGLLQQHKLKQQRAAYARLVRLARGRK
jgi:hypothetical protein